jgi:YihY family inner membrane protein
MYKRFFGPVLLSKVDRLSTYSAALAYCIVLSLVPFLAVTFVVGTHIAAELSLSKHYAEHYAEVLGNILPGQNTNDMARIFTAVQNSYKAKNGGFLFIGFLIAVYTSFNLMDQITRTLLFIFDDPRKPSEWTWKTYVKTFLLLLIWMGLLLLISISTIETAFLRRILEPLILSGLSKALTTVAQVLIVVTALFGTLYLTYLLVPVKSYQRALVVEGSLLSATGWILCSLIFAYVMPKILQTSASFIALGSIVAILLWAQACAWSIIIGACWIVRFSPARRK